MLGERSLIWKSALLVVLLFAGTAHADAVLNELMDRANSGDVPAQNELGRRYAAGRGIEQDFTKAREWFTRAAEHHGPAAMVNLGLLNLRGQGGPQDDAQAFSWFKQAADLNHAGGQYWTGYCYMNGIGIGKDLKQAKTFFVLSAAQGFRPASAALLNAANAARQEGTLF